MIRCGRLALGCAVLLGITACGERPSPTGGSTTSPVATSTSSLTFGNVCAACHGLRGEGNATLRAPSIAGLPEWYVALQLAKFQRNQRGADPLDADGQRMHAIARTLSSEQIATLATTVAAMERHPTQNTLGGDAARGKPYYIDYCTTCHRYNGSGELAFNSPPLIGLQDWYLVAQITKFRAGIRGTTPDDDDGAKMHVVANDLTDAHFRDVVAYIAELARRP
jgi:cytochrome c553